MTVHPNPSEVRSRGAAPAARRLAIATLALAVLIGVGVGFLWSRAGRSSDAEARIVPLEGRVLSGGSKLESFSGSLLLVERSTAPGESIWLLLRSAGGTTPSDYLPASMQLRFTDDENGRPTEWVAGIVTLAVPGLDLHWPGVGSLEPAPEKRDGTQIVTVWRAAGDLELELTLSITGRTPAAASKTVELSTEQLEAIWETWIAGAHLDD